MKHGRFLSLGLLAAASVCSASAAQSEGGVPATLLAKFKTGLNITRWFCYLGNPTDVHHYENYLVDADLSEFKKLGVTWVRLCISPEAIYKNGHPNEANLAYLDKAVSKLEKAGLAVLWDLHDNGQLKLDSAGQDNSGFITFWQDIARHYAGKKETSTVFELVNEPQFNKNPEVWYALQKKTVQAIREIDPKRTIMVSGHAWSGIETLAAMQPLPERNLIYTFHCYDPFLFTHQGATWVGDPPSGLKSMPFPASPTVLADALANSNPKDADTIKWYGSQKFDAAYLSNRIAKGMEFGHIHHVPVVLGEFGANPPVSPPESRGRWFAAMKVAIAKNHAPNALWGYDDGLGLGRQLQSNGTLTLDPVTLKSLFNQ